MFKTKPKHKSLKHIIKKFNKALKNNKVIIINREKYRQVGITTELLKLVEANDNYILIVNSNYVLAQYIKSYKINNIKDIGYKVLTIGALANDPKKYLFDKRELVLILDNSIDYKTYRKYITSNCNISSNPFIRISGIINEDLSTIEEFIY